VEAQLEVQIRFCATCGLAGRARKLAQRIRDELGVEVGIAPGHLGQFDVFADGVVVASRKGGMLNHVMHRGWPDEAAVIERLLRHRAGEQPGEAPAQS
jgi:predicted Rdx family selenoprotein